MLLYVLSGMEGLTRLKGIRLQLKLRVLEGALVFKWILLLQIIYL
ncbi:hypothetical protein SAMN03080602_01158 [Arenibacter troitsensis]|uniref:Uncharacterized protein n=1 Tax=Arenibacter troitsensis TaxID=188872 RepID=A0A1X7IUS7_9FLAO|nr:hypothetical protein SAMN03080602_01158 [Arenibacter troitsensis]